MSDDAGDVPAPGIADRRTFLRRLSGQAIEGAGRIGGMSQVVRRSVAAAGEAATRELTSAGDGVRPAAGPDGPAQAAAAGSLPPVPDPVAASATKALPARPPVLSPEQEAHLVAARSATLAVNDPGGHPHLTSSWFCWDGEVIRLPTPFFSARATNIARDPRVSLLIERADSDAWVAISGTAELVAVPAAVDASRPLFEKYRPGEDPVAAWTEHDRLGDQAVVIVRPARFVWRLG